MSQRLIDPASTFRKAGTWAMGGLIGLVAIAPICVLAQDEGAMISLELIAPDGTLTTNASLELGDPVRVVLSVTNPTSQVLEAIPLPRATRDELLEGSPVTVEIPGLPLEFLSLTIIKEPGSGTEVGLPYVFDTEEEASIPLTSQDVVVLAPGETRQETYRLTAYYVFPPLEEALGSYSAHAHWAGIDSNSIFFTITPPAE